MCLDCCLTCICHLAAAEVACSDRLIAIINVAGVLLIMLLLVMIAYAPSAVTVHLSVMAVLAVCFLLSINW